MRTTYSYELTRINCNLPTKLVDKVRAYSDEIGLPMTQTITLLLNQALESKDMLRELPKITQFIDEYRYNKYLDKSNDSLI